MVKPAPKYVADHYDFVSSKHSIKGNILEILETHQIQCRQSNQSSCALLFLDENSSKTEIQDLVNGLKKQDKKVIGIDLSKQSLPFYQIWQLLGTGMEEVLHWKLGSQLGEIILQRLVRWQIIKQILYSERVQKGIIGSSQAFHKVLEQVIEVACFSQAPVLIQGESGTGKELIAKLIHELDRRPDKQSSVILDCTTVVPELSGSEFFGHEKGAFTNAVSARDGAFALADKGTLFLDEIGELPMTLQAELLRAIQEGTFKRVGSNLWQKTKFRLVCATNRDLPKAVEQERFRQDLYYRLSACVIQLPPLRERKLDIPDLAGYFLKQILNLKKTPDFSPHVLNFLMTRQYPGNIRELRQLMSRIAFKHVGNGLITLGDIPLSDRGELTISENSWQENGLSDIIRNALANQVGLKEIKRIAANLAMDIAIEQANGNLQEAAKKLDVSDRTLQSYQATKREDPLNLPTKDP